MKENQMSRGKSQSLYKYLPDSWIDFSVRGKYRKNYIAHVERWNSEYSQEAIDSLNEFVRNILRWGCG